MSPKKVWKEKRYSLSTDVVIKPAKDNPIIEAQKIQDLKIKNPHLPNSQIANKLGISRPRVTQLLNLLKLAPDIQQHVLEYQDEKNIFTERKLRQLTTLKNHSEQRKIFQKMS